MTFKRINQGKVFDAFLGGDMAYNSENVNEILDEELNMEDDAEANIEKAEEILENLGLLDDDED